MVKTVKNMWSHSKTSAKRAFGISFALTLVTLILVVGLLVTDYRCRSTAFGDDSAVFAVSKIGDSTHLNVNAMGTKASYDITAGASVWEFICKFICIPHE